jgi:uncharacterized membrane protein YtjA (UPF0391 family)
VEVSHESGRKKSIRGDRRADSDGRITNVLLAIIAGLMIGAIIKSRSGPINIDLSGAASWIASILLNPVYAVFILLLLVGLWYGNRHGLFRGY